MTSLRWHSAVLLAGHGVASGQALDRAEPRLSPYPKGTIAMQTPFFAALGLDLSPYWPGTLNLSFSPAELQLTNPDYSFPDLEWTNLHPPETFSFWKVRLRSVELLDFDVPGLVYRPHPETKIRHWQNTSVLEILAPYLDGVCLGQRLELGVNPDAIKVLGSSLS